MTEKVTLDEALSMLAEIFEAGEDDIKPDASREDILGWDSLGVLGLMAEYDSRFGITLTSEQLEAMESVSDLIAVLKEHGALEET